MTSDVLHITRNPPTVVADPTGVEKSPRQRTADPAPDSPRHVLTEKSRKPRSPILRDAWLRARADADNKRKQAQADIAKTHKSPSKSLPKTSWPEGCARADARRGKRHAATLKSARS
jgi:hypothetical protein